MPRHFVAFTLVALLGSVVPESGATTVRTPALVFNSAYFPDRIEHAPACLILNTGATSFDATVWIFDDRGPDFPIFRTFPPGQVVVIANALVIGRGGCQLDGEFLRSRVKLTLCSVGVCTLPVLPGDTCANASEVACDVAVSSP